MKTNFIFFFLSLMVSFNSFSQEPCCGVFVDINFTNGFLLDDYSSRDKEVCPLLPVDGSFCSTEFTTKESILDNVDEPDTYCFIATVSGPDCPGYPRIYEFDNVNLSCSSIVIPLPRNTRAVIKFEYYERCEDCNNILPLNVFSRERFEKDFPVSTISNGDPIVSVTIIEATLLHFVGSINRTAQQCGQ